MPTTTRGYTYPASTEHARFWEHFETLADDINDDVQSIYERTETKPVGRIVQSVAQSGVTNNTMTATTFSNTDEIDTHDFHNPSVNNSRVTPTVAGIYRVNGAVAFTGQTDYVTVESVILFNGAAIPSATRLLTTSVNQTIVVPVSAYVSCNGSTDYFGVGFRFVRTSGTSGTVVSSQFASTLEWEYVRTTA